MVVASWSHLLKEPNVKYLPSMFLILAAAGCVPKDKAGTFQENADESGSTETVASADDSEENLLHVAGTVEDDPLTISLEENDTAPGQTGWVGPKALAELEKAGAEILQNENGQVIAVYLMSPLITDTHLEYLKGLTHLQRLGLQSDQITDAGMAHLEGMTHLQLLYVFHTQVTSAGMKHLQGLTNLKVLSLSNNSQISATGMEYVEGLTQLTHLYLADTPMTDAGLLPITGMTQLEVLGLRATQITDRGLKHLEALNNLRHLEIRSTQSTDTGAALPECFIDH